jgi:hypothetical protein
MDFDEILYLRLFWKSVNKIQASDESYRENQNTYFIFSNFFQKLWHLWGNVEKYGRARVVTDDNTICHMDFAYWITKGTNTHSEYVILICFPQQELHERASVLYYTYIPCLVSCSAFFIVFFFHKIRSSSEHFFLLHFLTFALFQHQFPIVISPTRSSKATSFYFFILIQSFCSFKGNTFSLPFNIYC